jgi:hypothetical protein
VLAPRGDEYPVLGDRDDALVDHAPSERSTSAGSWEQWLQVYLDAHSRYRALGAFFATLVGNQQRRLCLVS